MSAPAGMAIDPSLLFLHGRQAAEAAAAAAAQQQKVKNEDGVSADDEGGDRHPQAGSSNNGQQEQDGSASVITNNNDEQQENVSLPLADVPIDLRDDATLAAFLARMDEYEPLLPDAVTRFYLEKAGFQSSDDRVTRLLGLAAQKFVSDIASDAFAYARTRASTGPGRASQNIAHGAFLPNGTRAKDRTRTTLTLDDLSAAMREYGIDVTRAPYYR